MSITPEKNGCNVYLDEYGCYIHGDSYHFPDGLLVIRTCRQRFDEPEGGRVHYRIPEITHWFDENLDYGILFCKSHWSYYGYEGQIPNVLVFG